MSKRIDEYTKQNPVSGDAALGVTSTDSTRLFNLGTAASANGTTSATDTTAGRVMKVGDFGLGANTFSGGVPTIAQGTTDGSADLNKLQTVGFFQGAPTANAPPSGSVFAVRVEKHFEPAWVQQYAFSVTENRLFFRRTNASVWQAWQEFYHSGNYPSDTAWTTVTSLSNGWTGTVRYIKRAGWVTIVLSPANGGDSTDDTILILPSGYHPAITARGAAQIFPACDLMGILNVEVSGNVEIVGNNRSTNDFYGSITYPVI